MKNLLEDKKKYIGSLLFLGLLIGVTFYLFLKDNNPVQLWGIIRRANPLYIALGILAMLGFVACEGFSLRIILNSLGQKLSFLRCYKYAFIAFYYSSITPASSGGQPMQLYYMKKDNINLSLSSLTIFIIVFVYQIAELSFGFSMFLLKHDFVTEHVRGIGILLIYGIAFNLVLLCAILTAVFSKTLLKRFLNWGVLLLHRIKIIKQPERVLESLNQQIAEYQQGAAHIRKHPAVLLKVLIITLIQLACEFIVPFFVYRAFGLQEYSPLEILAVQSLLTLAVGSLPLPGAVGASESGFMLLFKIFFGSSLLLPAMMLSRGISFYLMLLISGTISVFVHILSQKKNAKYYIQTVSADIVSNHSEKYL